MLRKLLLYVFNFDASVDELNGKSPPTFSLLNSLIASFK